MWTSINDGFYPDAVLLDHSHTERADVDTSCFLAAGLKLDAR